MEKKKLHTLTKWRKWRPGSVRKHGYMNKQRNEGKRKRKKRKKETEY